MENLIGFKVKVKVKIKNVNKYCEIYIKSMDFK
jgi:hypothetical protein